VNRVFHLLTCGGQHQRCFFKELLPAPDYRSQFFGKDENALNELFFVLWIFLTGIGF